MSKVQRKNMMQTVDKDYYVDDSVVGNGKDQWLMSQLDDISPDEWTNALATNNDKFDKPVQALPAPTEQITPQPQVSDGMIIQVMQELTSIKESIASLEAASTVTPKQKGEEFAYRNPDFDNDNVLVSITISDADFIDVLRAFAEPIADEMVSHNLNKLSKAKKESYFTQLWDRTCLALYTLTNVESFHIAKWGNDLYDPNGPSEQVHTYMLANFKLRFGSNAQKVFNEFGEDGNGEFLFIDGTGVIGYS